MELRVFSTALICIWTGLLIRLAHAQDSADVFSTEDEGYEYFTFITRPELSAPKWEIEVYDQDALAPGYWFMAPYTELKQQTYSPWVAPFIYDSAGELIWSGAEFFGYHHVFDFQAVEVDGQQMLSMIAPGNKAETSDFEPETPDANWDQKDASGVILDNSYNAYETIDMCGEIPVVNIHDLTIAQNGKRAIMLTQKVYGESQIEIDSFRGSCKVGWQGFREVDLETGEVVFMWNAQGHIDLRESSKKEGTYEDMCETGWDILHFNSVDKFPDGDYLLSARHSNALYKVSHTDGSIVWRLGGTDSDFELQDPRGNFTRQHHGKVYSQNETHTLISLFNNARGAGQGPAEHASAKASSALLLALRTDVTPMTVDLVNKYDHPDARIVPSRGSLTFLPNGNAFVGWVYASLHSEHSFDGKLLMKAKLKCPPAHSYRAYKFPWIGRPSQPPDVVSNAVTNGSDGVSTLVHVSWNGATEVATWNLLHTDAAGNTLNEVASSPRRGFETALSFDAYAEYVVVTAHDNTGAEIGRSGVVQTLLTAEQVQLQHFQSWNSQSSQSTIPATRSLLPYIIMVVVLAFVCYCVARFSRKFSLRGGTKALLQEALFWKRSPTVAYERLADQEDKA